jgi:hypothetical protein
MVSAVVEETGVRSQNEEHLLSAGCLLLTAYCLLLTAHCTSGELGSAGLLPRSAAYDMMPPPRGKKRSSNFKN